MRCSVPWNLLSVSAWHARKIYSSSSTNPAILNEKNINSYERDAILENSAEYHWNTIILVKMYLKKLTREIIVIWLRYEKLVEINDNFGHQN